MNKNKFNGRAGEDILSTYLWEINKIPLLTREEEERLTKKMLHGDRGARKKLVLSNLRFVVSVAKRYQNCGLPFLDLINEGNMGLLRASEKFDPSFRCHFISYAVWWIKEAIIRAIIEKSKMIKVPDNERCELKSLDDRISIDGENIYANLIFDDKFVKPEDFAFKDILEDLINDVLEILPEKERMIIQYRYGLCSKPELSLERIGKKIGLSKERVRQLEKKATERLKNSSKFFKLKTFLLQ